MNKESNERQVSELREELDRSKKGLVKQTLQNCRMILENDPNLCGAICRNSLSGQIDIIKDVPWKRRGNHLTDTDMNNLAYYLETEYGITSDRVITKTVDIVANENAFHPIIDYLETLVWDGTPRIEHVLHHFFGTEENPYNAEVMKLHMLAAIHRLYVPGTKYDIMLCLVGGQGTGKSTFFRLLAIKDEWYSDDLKRLDDKRVFEYMQGHWIIEMSEMSAIANSKTIEETKAFLSRQKETFRMPYEKRAEDRPRQCVFCGTSNDMEFLPLDRTGNRRFAPVLTHPDRAEVKVFDDLKESRAYIVQMWAEAMEIYRSLDGRPKLTFSEDLEEYAKEMQLRFMPEDTLGGMIQAFLDHYEEDYVCCAIIYQQVLKGVGIPPRWQSREIGIIMNSQIEGWERDKLHRFGSDIGTQKSWKRINPLTDEDGFMKVINEADLPFK